MATTEVTFLHGQLEERRRRLEAAMAMAPQNRGLAGLLREVDSALDRMDKGTYGFCQECHDPVEQDRLLADPLVRYCLDHLTQSQRADLQRDLDLASQVQRNLLPQRGLRVGGWETGYHYAPLGAVSGDYCDLIAYDGSLFFVLGDVSGKGVAASMLMTQLHALFRSLTALALPLKQIVTQVNRVFCESALAGQYATLICGQAKANGEIQIQNAGHWPALVVGPRGVVSVESSGLPLGMFCETEFTATSLEFEVGDALFLYSDGLSEARSAADEYGIERITSFVRQQGATSPSEMIGACIRDLQAFTGSTPLMDDLTLLSIRRC
ncbi:MAG TPA: SpoIIE family protein phosphatase [Terriglobales bacterium]